MLKILGAFAESSPISRLCSSCSPLISARYDRDSSGAGVAKLDEFNAMLKELYGKRYSKNTTAVNLLRHINQMTKRRDTDEVDVEAFAEFCRTHPAMLMPAFAMQTTMRERIMGGAWWDRRSNERVKVGRHTMRIHDLLKAHLQEDAFHSFMRAVDSDGKAMKRDADKHRDWKSATEVTGTVAQRRRKSGQHELQDRPLDKYSRSSARGASRVLMIPARCGRIRTPPCDGVVRIKAAGPRSLRLPALGGGAEGAPGPRRGAQEAPRRARRPAAEGRRGWCWGCARRRATLPRLVCDKPCGYLRDARARRRREGGAQPVVAAAHRACHQCIRARPSGCRIHSSIQCMRTRSSGIASERVERYGRLQRSSGDLVVGPPNLVAERLRL